MAIRRRRHQKRQRLRRRHRPLPLAKRQSRPNLQLKQLSVGANHLTICLLINVRLLPTFYRWKMEIVIVFKTSLLRC